MIRALLLSVGLAFAGNACLGQVCTSEGCSNAAYIDIKREGAWQDGSYTLEPSLDDDQRSCAFVVPDDLPAKGHGFSLDCGDGIDVQLRQRSKCTSTTSNDGVRLWIGNELVIDNWSNQSGAEATGAKRLEAGKWTDVRFEYYENVGQADVELRWSSARQTGAGVFEVVPQESLRSIKHMPVTFKNPLGTGADPFVIQLQGKYYMSR